LLYAMQRLLLLFLILALLLTPGCRNKKQLGQSNQQNSSWDPLDVFMVHHIRTAHKLYIGAEPYNELIVEYDGKLVSVRFSESMTEQTSGQIYEVFNLPETGQQMEKEEYLVFLMKLHAYLTINPVKRKIEDN
jgi:hypothetical protein